MNRTVFKVKFLEKQFNDAQSQLRDIVSTLVNPPVALTHDPLSLIVRQGNKALQFYVPFLYKFTVYRIRTSLLSNKLLCLTPSVMNVSITLDAHHLTHTHTNDSQKPVLGSVLSRFTLTFFFMEPSTLVATPLFPKPTPSLSPSPSSFTSPSTPGLTRSSDDYYRSSSETTMEIYSLYGDDNRSSWPIDGPFKPDPRASNLSYRNSSGHTPRFSTTLKDHRPSQTDTTHRDSASSTDTSSPYISIEEEDIPVALPGLSPPTPPAKPVQRISARGTNPPNLASDDTPELVSLRYLSPSPPQSRPSSSRSHASSGQAAHASAILRSSPGPPSEHMSVTTPPLPTSRPPSQTTGTSTSHRLLGRKRSDLSITPSAGEDPDSFHVRSTYAQLDVLGVKGDGIEEGVELTRARVGSSRESELKAANAIGDESEKRRDLNPKELQMLASLDR